MFVGFSTLSSSLNSLSAVTWKDMVEWKFKHIPESRKALATKILGNYNVDTKMANILQNQCDLSVAITLQYFIN